MTEYCQRCQKEAAKVHVTEIDAEGKKALLHLCEECAKGHGLPAQPAPTVLAVFKELVDKANTVARTRDRQCPECGTTFAEFKAKGRFGCAHDYEVFQARVVPLLERIHGASEHVGEADGARAQKSASDSAAQELRRLRRDLQRVVKSEEYEEAARLRDRITTLEKQLAEGNQLDG
ncbi:MAG: UvrB/UvrC motif-containing protein [Planctomycetes bacterium]|nr:UvrB/UvrC motif-containing protein [Planctomycetota bacterium]